MLVITRNIGESFFIEVDGKTIEVKRQGKNRLAVNAPKEVRIIRAELRGKPRRERGSAA